MFFYGVYFDYLRVFVSCQLLFVSFYKLFYSLTTTLNEN